MFFLSSGFFVVLVFLVHAQNKTHSSMGCACFKKPCVLFAQKKKEKKENQTPYAITSGGRARAARGRGGRGGGKDPEEKERRLESRVLEPLLETYEKRETSQFLTNFSKSGVGQSKGGDEEEEERKGDVNDDDERGEEKDDDDDDDEKMRRLFAHTA